MTKKYILAVSVLLLAMALPVQADIYKCVGADGHVTYANVADKNCKRLTLDPPAPAAAKPAARSASASVSAPTPTNFPKVDDSAQRSRDSDRRRILENELETEQRNRDQARKELAEQEAARPGAQKTGDALQTFKDRLALHERNIEAIRSELSRIR